MAPPSTKRLVTTLLQVQAPKARIPSVVSQQDQEDDAPLPIGHVSEVLIAIASTLIWSYGVI